jgi:hypothetical protein
MLVVDRGPAKKATYQPSNQPNTNDPMREALIERLARDIATYLRMSCSLDWTDVDIARYLRMEYGALDRIENEFGRIGEAIGDPVGADFYNVATEVEKLVIKHDRTHKCLEELYSVACNGMISDDLLCMEEASKLIDGEDE